MVCTYRRILWFSFSLAGEVTSAACTLTLLILALALRCFRFDLLISTITLISTIIFVTFLMINIFYMYKPSVSGFKVNFAISIFSIILQIVTFSIITYSFKEHYDPEKLSVVWNEFYKALTLDDIQEALQCCGYDNTDLRNKGRNGFCYRLDTAGKFPMCKEKIQNSYVKPSRIASIILISSVVFNVVAAFFGYVLIRADPSEEFSPDTETILSSGLLKELGKQKTN